MNLEPVCMAGAKIKLVSRHDDKAIRNNALWQKIDNLYPSFR